MRINVYADELQPIEDEEGRRVTLVHKEVVDVPFSAIEMIIDKRKIHTKIGKEVDDDSSVIRFWFSDETTRGYLVEMFEAALKELRKPDAMKQQ
ncbi:MAG: hypothetical protein ACJ8IK_26315 [Burkholderiaceae bacterium]